MIITLRNVCGMIPVMIVAIGLVYPVAQVCWIYLQMFGMHGCIIINKYSHNQHKLCKNFWEADASHVGCCQGN